MIIALLPFLLHVALFLFIAGLLLFLRPFEQGSWWITRIFLYSTVGIYLVATILPVLFPACPYRTRLFELIRFLGRSSLKRLSHIARLCVGWVSSSPRGRRRRFGVYSEPGPHEDELKRVDANETALTARSLHWLSASSPLAEVFQTVLRAVSQIMPASALAQHVQSLGFLNLILQDLNTSHPQWHSTIPNPSERPAPEAEDLSSQTIYLRAVTCSGVHLGLGESQYDSIQPRSSSNIPQYGAHDWLAQLSSLIIQHSPILDDKRRAAIASCDLNSSLLETLTYQNAHGTTTSAQPWSLHAAAQLFNLLSAADMSNTQFNSRNFRTSGIRIVLHVIGSNPNDLQELFSSALSTLSHLLGRTAESWDMAIKGIVREFC